MRDVTGHRQPFQVYRAGIVPEALFGCEMVRIPPAMIVSLRQAAFRAAKIKPLGVPARLKVLLLGPETDPAYILLAHVLTTWAREWWLTTAQHDEVPKDVLSVKELSLLRALPMPDGMFELPFQAQCKDPVTLIHAQLAAIQWDWV
jgi:hypothetical protein